jgi:hypothetical protein
MITGIGTPTNQSKIPFPIVSSAKSSYREGNARVRTGFLCDLGVSDRKIRFKKKRAAVLIDGIAHFRI